VSQYFAANQYTRTLHISCGILQNVLRGGDVSRLTVYNDKGLRGVSGDVSMSRNSITMRCERVLICLR
jgi:hypothetical protein